jgi:hypothetical protein
MEDGLVSSLESIGRRDVSDGRVEPVVVVVVDEGADFASGVVEGERRLESVAFALERLMPSFGLAVALWLSGGDADMCHAECSDELFEVAGDELGSVVGDEARLGVGKYQWIHAASLFTVPKRGHVCRTEYEDLTDAGPLRAATQGSRFTVAE